MFKDISFESERLKTKPLEVEDAELLFQIYSDTEAMKYRGSKPMVDIGEAIDMIEKEYVVDGDISKLRLGIIEKSNNNFIGTLLLVRNKEFEHLCEIGFSFGKEYWGNGYGQETLKLIEGELKAYNNIEQLKAWCVKENIASVRIFEKTGFYNVEQNDYPQSHLFMKKIK